MSSDISPLSWTIRRPARWSMPVCLQPRAPRICRIVRAVDKRPARLSGWGYHLRPHGHYQLEIAAAEEAEQPSAVALSGSCVRRTNELEERLTQDGRTLRRLDFEVARDDDGGRFPRFWWSRIEPLVIRLQYADGRDDYEQRCWLIVTPRRAWALAALLSSVVLYGLVPWLSRMILEQGDLPAVWSRLLQVLSRPDVWLGLMLVIAGVWLAAVVSDRIQLALRRQQLRKVARQEVQQYCS